MKTIKELFNEIAGSDELKKTYETAVKSGDEAVETFLKEHGCEATVEDIRNFFREQQEARELSEDEVAGVAGGTWTNGICDIRIYSMGPGMCLSDYSDIIDPDGNSVPLTCG